LAGACRLLLDANTDETKDALFERFPREQLVAAISAVEAIAQAAEGDHVCEQMLRFYPTIRRFLPC
jgi:hypothetical protein